MGGHVVPGLLANDRGVNYNRGVSGQSPSYVQRYVFSVFLALSVVALAGASCDKKTAASSDGANDVVRAIDQVEGKGTTNTAGTARPVSREPIPGVDLADLDDRKIDRFYGLVDSLQSPCGKTHSLRTSLTSDRECKRAPFAARYVIQLLSDELDEGEVKQFYELRYKASEQKSFSLEGTPHSGPPDAPVKLVEFFDYGCGACKQFAPILKEAISAFPDDAVLFYKQFPLPKHPNSKLAAQAALAAHAQGKYVEMHELLFDKAPLHRKPELTEYARSLGLNMQKFEADFAAMLPRVEADVTDGDKAGIMGTPTLYINGRVYEGPSHPRYIQLWIEEELAVNR
jgi:protein-disulfide isomerase